MLWKEHSRKEGGPMRNYKFDALIKQGNPNDLLLSIH